MKALRWQDVSEKGSVLGIRVVVAVARLLGRRAAGWMVRLAAVWYALFHPSVRRASRAYLRRLGAGAGLRDVVHHVFTFAQVATDRIFLVAGEVERFRIARQGDGLLFALRDQGRGALLLMSHMGSFEILRTLSRERKLPINVLGYFRNATRINDALRRIDPTVDARLIEIRPNDPSFVFEVEDRIRRGEMVGTMGDRVGFDGKSVRVPFLGAEASFPTGPYLLAAALRCPVLLGFGLYRAPDRYDLYAEPFADAIVLPRGPEREAVLGDLATRYARRVEHYCRAYPDNWFNFYDFWSAA
jgi:predicted LPLAT superfamily acyltransferase